MRDASRPAATLRLTSPATTAATRASQRLFFHLVRLGVMPGGEDAAAPVPAEAAVVAETWMQHLDAANYRACWSSLAGVARSAIPLVRLLGTDRIRKARLGSLQQRTRSGVGAAELEAGSGEEWRSTTVEFVSVYARKPRVVEKITLLRESDGVWRVAGIGLD